jgi:hypothetical protein
LLLSPESNQLRIDGQDFVDCISIRPPSICQRLNDLKQVLRDELDSSFAFDAIGESPHRVALVFRAVAGCLAAFAEHLIQGAPQGVLRDAETSSEGMLAAPKS